MKPALIASLVGILAAVDVAAQGRGSASAKPGRTTQVRVTVKAQDGLAVSDAKLVLSGDEPGEFTTGGAGTAILPNLKDGTYRVRVERDGFITLEREFSLRGGLPAAIDVTLNPEPPAAPPPPPPPPPTPAKAALAPSGPPVNLSVIDFIERNFIGNKEPLKESILACTPLETVRLLQMRESIASHRHADVDEVLYVVAGEGTARLGNQSVPLKAGTMVVVPHATEHAFERRGKNPLMMLSTLAGAPCHESAESR